MQRNDEKNDAKHYIERSADGSPGRAGVEKQMIVV